MDHFLSPFRGCTWFASIRSTPGTPAETTCTCATPTTCACCPGSKSSSEHLPLSGANDYCSALRREAASHVFFRQQIWLVHQDHGDARDRHAEAVLPVSDRQVLSWNTEVVKRTTLDSTATAYRNKVGLVSFCWSFVIIVIVCVVAYTGLII